MVLKRSFGECGDDFEAVDGELRRRLDFSTVLRDVVSGLSIPEFASSLEPLFRRVVRDEVEHAIQPLRHSYQRSTPNQIEANTSRTYRLEFENRLPPTLFTGSRIESDESESIRIVIKDSRTNDIITCGPLSSIRVEIVALDGDFGADDRENWSGRDFSTNILRERQGKRPLVTGDLVITLRCGVGYIGDVSITDNSSWTRCRKFRLGAKVHGSCADPSSIREARSEAFNVKDHRGESYKKNHPPSPTDETWRLERIAKDGKFHDRLGKKGILTVKDFLRLYYSNPSLLRNILGGGISNKTWDTIVDHANECVLDDKLYTYSPNGEAIVLVFNSVYKVLGAMFDGQNFKCIENLDAYQMRVVEDVKRRAYKNLNEIVVIEDSPVGTPPLQVNSIDHPTLHSPNFSLPVDNQVQQESNYIAMPPLCPYETEETGSVNISMPHNSHSIRSFSPSFQNSFFMRDFCYDPMVNGNLAVDQAESSLWGKSRFSFGRSYPSVDLFQSNLGFKLSGRARWCMIRAAFKWGISVRRDVAAKKMARFLCVDF